MSTADEELDLFAKRYVAEMRDINSSDAVYWEILDDLIRKEAAKAWKAILAISRVATEGELGRLGAGPLESLLIAHESLISRVALEARTNSAIRSMLSCVYTHDLTPQARKLILDTITHAAG